MTERLDGGDQTGGDETLQPARMRAIAGAAKAWADPDYPVRTEATRRTLSCENRFTVEAITFAVNQQMHQLSVAAMKEWIGDRVSKYPRTVGVLNAGNIPMVELQDFLAVVLSGHRYLGTVSGKSPHLFPAFVDDLRTRFPGLCARFVQAEDLFDAADGVIGTGTDETAAWLADQCDGAGIAAQRRLIRGHRYSVAVVDGRERADDREGLAEDALLHEGMGCRNVSLIWAPAGHSPDPYLDAFAVFRSVFPPHPATPGALEMQRSLLAAFNQSHAYGEGMEFLLSKGNPEVQLPGHLRWAEYGSLDDVYDWLEDHERRIQVIVARKGMLDEKRISRPVISPGNAQRPPLDWQPDGINTLDFLIGLQAGPVGQRLK